MTAKDFLERETEKLNVVAEKRRLGKGYSTD